jgi:nucleotide-binding universal stress UspA family protein
MMIALNNILVSTDFGSASATAVAYRRALAGRFGSTLHVLHVTAEIYLAAAVGYGYTGAPTDAQDEIERAAQTQVDALLTEDDRHALHARSIVVTHNTPAAAIVEYAKRHDIDLIVVGTHGRGAFAHLFMGSVAERVVRTAPCPVLTVRHPEHEFVLPDALTAMPPA